MDSSLAAMPAAQDSGMPNGDHVETNGVNGSEHSASSHTNGVHATNSFDIPLNRQYAYTPRKLKVVTIGAGFSGLLMAHKFQHRFPEMQDYVEHTIFERNSKIGGTWLVNTYPGVRCDVPSHIYVRRSETNRLKPTRLTEY